MAMVFQETSLVPPMTVAQNLYLGRLAAAAPPIVSYAAMAQLAETWRAKMNIKSINVDARVIEMSGGNQRKVAIAKSLVQSPRMVIFDEPTRGVGRELFTFWSFRHLFHPILFQSVGGRNLHKAP